MINIINLKLQTVNTTEIILINKRPAMFELLRPRCLERDWNILNGKIRHQTAPQRKTQKQRKPA